MARKKDPFCEAVDKFIVKQTIKENKRYLERKKKEGVKEGKLANSFSPSFISSKECLRAWYYHYLKTPEDPGVNPRLQRIFANGHRMHDRVQSMLNKMGVLEEEDIEIGIVDDEWMISGKVDGVVKRKKGDEIQRLVLEIKSINAWGFSEVEKKGPKVEHKRQANIYMWLLDIEEAIIYYECKNSQQHMSSIIKYSPRMVEKQVKNKIIKVLEHVKLEEIPDVCYNGAIKDCEWCNWKERCQDEGGKRRKNIIKI